MNNQLRELYNSYLQQEPAELADYGRQMFGNIMSRFYNKTGDKELAFEFALAVFSVFTAEDGSLDANEWAMFEYFMQEDMPREKVIEIVKSSYDESTYGQIKEIIEYDSDMKQEVLKLGLCICAIDKSIDEKESQLLQYFIG